MRRVNGTFASFACSLLTEGCAADAVFSVWAVATANAENTSNIARPKRFVARTITDDLKGSGSIVKLIGLGSDRDGDCPQRNTEKKTRSISRLTHCLT